MFAGLRDWIFGFGEMLSGIVLRWTYRRRNIIFFPTIDLFLLRYNRSLGLILIAGAILALVPKFSPAIVLALVAAAATFLL